MSIPTPILQYNLSEPTIKRLLPEGYTPLDSCNYSGIINTDITANDNLRFEAKVNSGTFPIQDTLNKIRVNLNTTVIWGEVTYNPAFYFNGLEAHHFLYDNTGVKIDGLVKKIFNLTHSFANSGEIQLFYSGSSEVFYARIWDNDVLVKDYYPCINNSSNLFGLYEINSGQFYASAVLNTWQNSSPVGYTYPMKCPYGKVGFSLPLEYLQINNITITQGNSITIPYNTTLTMYARIGSLSTGGSQSYSTTYSDNIWNNLQNYRIFEFKLYSNNELVYNMIPCYRRIDLERGFYDTINLEFYTNTGSGELSFGRTAETGYTSEINSAKHADNITEEFLEVQYLESTTLLAIRQLAGPDSSNECTIYCTFLILNPESLLRRDIYGVDDLYVSNLNLYKAYRLFSSNSKLFITTNSDENHYDEVTITDDVYTILHSRNSFILKNLNTLEVYINNSPDMYGEFSGYLGMCLFSNNTSSEGIRIYNYKFYHNNILVYDLVPCYRKSNIQSSGFYNNVKYGSFITANYSNLFLLGPDIYGEDGIYHNISAKYDLEKNWSANFNGTSYIKGPQFKQTATIGSISFWVNPENLNNQVWFSESTSKIACGYWNGHLIISTSGRSLPCFNIGTLSANSWNHIVVVYDTTPKVYINGVSMSTTGSSSYWTVTTSPLIIGGKYNNAFQYGFVGQIQNFLIFSDILTEIQVKELYGK